MTTQIICDKCKKVIEYDRNIIHIYVINGYSIDSAGKNRYIDVVIDLCDDDMKEFLDKANVLVKEYSQ